MFYTFVYMAAILSLAFLLSAFINSSSISITLTFFTIMMLFPLLNMIFEMVDIDSSWIITNYSSLITEIFRFPSEAFGPAALNGSPDTTSFNEGIFYCLTYFSLGFIICLVKTLQKEV